MQKNAFSFNFKQTTTVILGWKNSKKYTSSQFLEYLTSTFIIHIFKHSIHKYINIETSILKLKHPLKNKNCFERALSHFTTTVQSNLPVDPKLSNNLLQT